MPEGRLAPAPTLPPGPRGGRFSGTRPEYAADPLGFLTRCAAEYGDVVRIAPSNYLVVHPRDIATVLVDRQGAFVKIRPGVRRRSHAGFPQAMMNSEGDDWRVKRQRLTPAFAREQVLRHASAVEEETSRAVASWGHGQVLDVHQAMADLALRIAARALVGTPLGDGATAVKAAVDAIMRLTATPFRFPAWVPTPTNRQLARSLGRLDGLLGDLVQTAGAGRQERQERQESQEPQERTALALLLGDDPVLSATAVRDELATLIMSGYETTADALTWTLFLLGTHPQVEAALRQSLAAEDEPSLLDAVLKESLRLYPPAWVTSRVAVRDSRLGDFNVPAGTTVAVSQWVTHRDGRWYPEPERFLPERWFGEPPPRYAFIPYGSGPRACIGAALATQELTGILRCLLRETRLSLVGADAVRPRPALALQPLGVRARVDKHGGLARPQAL
jgi:cytochrome P450